MSSSNSEALTPPARIPMGTFIGVQWGGVALAWIFFITRVAGRIKAFRRVYADDAMVLVACLLLMTNTLIWQMSKDDLYEIIAVESGQLYPPPADLASNATSYLKRSVAVIAFFYSGLWAIKLSFMLFFRRLGQNVTGQKVLWWTILVIVVASWLACLGTIHYRCLTGSFEYIETVCTTPAAVAFDRNTFRWNMIMDVVTDALIILVPVKLLWNVQISLQRKLALTALFSITVIIMVFAIIRVVVVSSFSHQLDQTWLYMWGSIEQTVSILVACLASFRALFTTTNRPSHQRISDEKPKPFARKFAPKLTVPLYSRFNAGSLFDRFTNNTNNTAATTIRTNDITLVDVESLEPRHGAGTVTSAVSGGGGRGKDDWVEYEESTRGGSTEQIFPPANKVLVRHEIHTV